MLDQLKFEIGWLKREPADKKFEVKFYNEFSFKWKRFFESSDNGTVFNKDNCDTYSCVGLPGIIRHLIH